MKTKVIILLINAIIFINLSSYSTNPLIKTKEGLSYTKNFGTINNPYNINAEKSNLNFTSKSIIYGDYGSNMFSFNPALLIFGYINFNYERFSQSRKSSIRIPVLIDFTDGEPNNNELTHNDYRVNLKTGFEHRFFPTGSDGVVRGFFGYAQHFGMLTVKEYYSNSYWDFGGYYYYNESRHESYFFEDTQLIGGVQFQASPLINITLDTGIGLGLYDFEEAYLSYSLGLNLGFRF